MYTYISTRIGVVAKIKLGCVERNQPDAVFLNRSPETKYRSVNYLALDGEKSLFTTFLTAAEYIQASLDKVSSE